MGVSENGGTPKWMVYMENPIKMDDLGVPLFSETSKYFPSTTLFHGCNLPITIFFQGQRQAVLGSFYHSVTSAPILPVQVSQTNRSRNSRQRPLRKSPH